MISGLVIGQTSCITISVATNNERNSQKGGYRNEFLGVPVQASPEGNALIAFDDTRVQLST